MKNILIFIIGIFTFGSCKKVEETKNYIQSEVENFLPANPLLAKNYCYGCGSSNDENWGCTGTSCTHNGNCGYKRATVYIENYNSDNDSNKDNIYLIRDSFLINSEFGQKYITYYYGLSDIAINNNLINIGNYYEYYNLSVELVNAFNLIKDNIEGEVPFTIDLSNKIDDLINEYRIHTNDKLYISYLDEIEKDLKEIKGKDVMFVRLWLKIKTI